MRKNVFKAAVFIVVFALSACGENADSSSSSTAVSDSLSVAGNSSSDTAEKDSADDLITSDSLSSTNKGLKPDISKMPGIKGSQAYDIIISLDDAGLSQHDTVKIDDGFMWEQATTEYSYSITSNSEHEIAYARFFDLTGNGKDYLMFCATMPYDTSDNETAKTWVSDNMGVEATTTIGDAVFTMSVGKQGSILTIEAFGYDKYLNAYLDKKLSE